MQRARHAALQFQHRFPLAARARSARQQLRLQAHGRQRSQQFMRRIGDESALLGNDFRESLHQVVERMGDRRYIRRQTRGVERRHVAMRPQSQLQCDAREGAQAK
jgi:hypothetical protein